MAYTTKFCFLWHKWIVNRKEFSAQNSACTVFCFAYCLVQHFKEVVLRKNCLTKYSRCYWTTTVLSRTYLSLRRLLVWRIGAVGVTPSPITGPAAGQTTIIYTTQSRKMVFAQQTKAIFRNNLALIEPDGSCWNSYIYLERINGCPAGRLDIGSNDQDWTFYLLLKNFDGHYILRNSVLLDIVTLI